MNEPILKKLSLSLRVSYGLALFAAVALGVFVSISYKLQASSLIFSSWKFALPLLFSYSIALFLMDRKLRKKNDLKARATGSIASWSLLLGILLAVLSLVGVIYFSSSWSTFVSARPSVDDVVGENGRNVLMFVQYGLLSSAVISVLNLIVSTFQIVRGGMVVLARWSGATKDKKISS